MPLYLEIQNKKQIDLASPQMVRSEIQNTKVKLNQNAQSIRSLQTGLGTLGQDLSLAKEKIPQNPAMALAKIGSDIQSMSAQLDLVKNNTRDLNTKELALTSQVNGISDTLIKVDGLSKDADQKLAIVDLQHKHLLDKLAETLIKVDTLSKDTDAELVVVDAQHKQLLDQTNTLVREVRNLSYEHNSKIQELCQCLQMEKTKIAQQGKALSGDMYLVAEDAEDVSAALLNAAIASSFTKETIIQFASKEVIDEEDIYTTHNWANFEPVITSAEVVVDVDVAAPTVTWADGVEDDPKFINGEVRLTVTFDTDAGATKTYALGDVVTVIAKVTADDKLFGFTVASVTKTYNVIA